MTANTNNQNADNRNADNQNADNRDTATAIGRVLRRTALAARLVGSLRVAAHAVVLLATLFLLNFGFDQFFDPRFPARFALGSISVGAVVVFLVLKLAPLWFRPVPVRTVAAFYERRYPEFDESLMTSADSLDAPESEEESRRRFLEATKHKALALLAQTRVTALFDTRALGRLFGTAALALAAALFVGWVYGERTREWFARMNPCADQSALSRTKLFIDGADGRSIVHVRRGDPLELRVCSPCATGRPAARVNVTLRFDSETEERRTLRSFRVETIDSAAGGACPCRVFAVRLTGATRAFTLVARAGDAIAACRVEPRDPPVVVSTLVEKRFPERYRREPVVEPSDGTVVVPEGTSLVFTIDLDRPIAEARHEPPSSGMSLVYDGKTRIKITMEAVERRRSFGLVLVDRYGIRSAEPVVYRVGVTVDLAPVVTAATPVRGRQIVADAVVPFTAECRDDFGLRTVALRYRKTGTPDGTLPLATLPNRPTEYRLADSMRLADLAPNVGDRITLQVEAGDGKPVGREGGSVRYQTGTGPAWEFEIVSPDRMKEILATRELGYRDRLANLIREVERTKKALEEPTAAEQSGRLLRDAQKESYDAATLARGIGELADEITLNDTKRDATLYLPGYSEDLRRQVATPLGEVARENFESLARDLNRLGDRNTTESAREEARQSAQKTTEAIAAKMGAALEHIRDIQSFQALADEFRRIRTDVRRSREQTEQHKTELLEELLK